MRTISKKCGFTLLEMVVVIGVLSVLVGAGVATLVPFKERREVLSDARNMASLLKQTQVKASAVEIPGSCSNVGEFVIENKDGGREVDLKVIDSTGFVCSTGEVLRFISGAKFQTGGDVRFKTPFGSASSVTIEICNYGIQYDLEVGENGNVSEPKKSVTSGCQ